MSDMKREGNSSKFPLIGTARIKIPNPCIKLVGAYLILEASALVSPRFSSAMFFVSPSGLVWS